MSFPLPLLCFLCVKLVSKHINFLLITFYLKTSINNMFFNYSPGPVLNSTDEFLMFCPVQLTELSSVTDQAHSGCQCVALQLI